MISHQLLVTVKSAALIDFHFSPFFVIQNLLTSEQSYIILKSITKLPLDLAPTYYPTLLTIIWENPEAEAILGKDFEINVSIFWVSLHPRFISFTQLLSLCLNHFKIFFFSFSDAERIRKIITCQEESAPASAGNLKN
jgi:hypothetical protein